MEASQQTPAMPTPEDAQAIFTRAEEAARRAETAAQRMEAAQGAAQEETERRWPDMPPELVKQISDASAKAVVDALNAQYELRSPPTTPPAGTGDGGTTSGDDGASGASEPPATPERKRSIADRILGT